MCPSIDCYLPLDVWIVLYISFRFPPPNAYTHIVYTLRQIFPLHSNTASAIYLYAPSHKFLRRGNLLMLIQNKSSTVVVVILCQGKVASPFQYGEISTKRDGDGTTVACKGLLRWYAFVGIATRPGVLFEGCRRNRWIHPDETRYRRNQGEGKETQAENPLQSVEKKNNIAESGRKRQKRGGRARAGKKRSELK